jgi:hypothetical protein
MDSQPQLTPQDLEQLTPSDQRYLAEFMNNQATTAQLQNSTHPSLNSPFPVSEPLDVPNCHRDRLQHPDHFKCSLQDRS